MKKPHHYQSQILKEVKQMLIKEREELKNDLDNGITDQETFDACDKEAEESIREIDRELQRLQLITIKPIYGRRYITNIN